MEGAAHRGIEPSPRPATSRFARLTLRPITHSSNGVAKKGIAMDASQAPPTMQHDTSQPFGPAPPVQQKVINLALQGGGAHGAFTWGVLDRLLDDLNCV